jgi:hypothetical protein
MVAFKECEFLHPAGLLPTGVKTITNLHFSGGECVSQEHPQSRRAESDRPTRRRVLAAVCPSSTMCATNTPPAAAVGPA